MNIVHLSYKYHINIAVAANKLKVMIKSVDNSAATFFHIYVWLSCTFLNVFPFYPHSRLHFDIFVKQFLLNFY